MPTTIPGDEHSTDEPRAPHFSGGRRDWVPTVQLARSMVRFVWLAAATLLLVATACRPGSDAPTETPDPSRPAIAPTGQPSTAIAAGTTAVPRPTLVSPTATTVPVPPPVVLKTAEVVGWDRPLDPHRTTSSTFFRFFGNTYSGLVRWDTSPGGEQDVRLVVPDLAESWSQRDGQTWEFHLREGARWHDVPPVDGRLVTPEDVVFNVQRLMGSIHAPMWRDVASVTVEGARTVRITLTQPYIPFLEQLASGFNVLVPPDAAVPLGIETDGLGPLIGTGPFVFDAAHSHYLTRGVFNRNPDFYLPGVPGFDRLDRIIVGSEESALALLRTGAIDFLFLPPTEAEGLMVSRPEYGFTPQAELSGWALSFKQTGPFATAMARYAASIAIDRAALWRTYSGTNTPAELGIGIPLPNGDSVLPADELARASQRDLGEATTILDSIGAPAEIPFVVTMPDAGPGPVAAGMELVQQLREVGFVAEPLVVSSAIYATVVEPPPGVFEVSFGPVVGPPEADLWLTGRLGLGEAFNVIGRVDTELAGLIEAQRAEANPAARAALLRSVQRLLIARSYQTMVFRDQTWLVTRAGWVGWPETFFDEPFQRFLRDVSPSKQG